MQFVKGLRTLYDGGARIFVEVGPKKALQGFAEEVLGRSRRRGYVLYQPSESWRCREFQSSAVRALCGGIGKCNQVEEKAFASRFPSNPQRLCRSHCRSQDPVPMLGQLLASAKRRALPAADGLHSRETRAACA